MVWDQSSQDWRFWALKFHVWALNYINISSYINQHIEGNISNKFCFIKKSIPVSPSQLCFLDKKGSKTNYVSNTCRPTVDNLGTGLKHNASAKSPNLKVNSTQLMLHSVEASRCLCPWPVGGGLWHSSSCRKWPGRHTRIFTDWQISQINYQRPLRWHRCKCHCHWPGRGNCTFTWRSFDRFGR